MTAIALPRPWFIPDWLKLGTLGLLGFILMLTTVTSNVFQADVTDALYVDAVNGSDTNSGTSSTDAWKTLQKAGNNVSAGDTVLIMNGTYEVDGGAQLLNTTADGTADNWITWTNFPGHSPILGDAGTSFAMRIRGDYHRIKGLHFRGTSDECISMADSGVAMRNVEILDNYFEDCGIGFQDCNNSNGKSAIFANRSMLNVLVEGNTFDRPGRAADDSCDWMSTSTNNHQYRHDHAIYAQGRGWIIRNNIFFNTPYGSVITVRPFDTSVLGPLPAGEYTHYIVFNTFGPNIGDEVGNPYRTQDAPIIQPFRNTSQSEVSRYYIAANIFVDPTASGSHPRVGGLQYSGTSTSYINEFNGKHVCKDNIAQGSEQFSAGDASVSCHFEYDFSPYNTYGSFFTETDNNSNQNTLASLDMTDPANFNYRIGSSSVAINHVDCSTILNAPTLDFDDNPKGTGLCAAGAFEPQ